MKLALIAEYDPSFEPHAQTDAAIEHSTSFLGIEVRHQWISTADLSIARLADFDALWFAPGSPYRDLARTLAAIRYAREHDVPTLGTCGGFQHLVIEFARHVIGITDAQHAEYDPYASRMIVTRLRCSLVGKEMPLSLVPDSKTAAAYGSVVATERFYCNFGVNPEYVEPLSQRGFAVVGVDDSGECRVMELPRHRFYIGTLFVPQAKSRAGHPHPLINAFFRAASA